MEKEIKNIKYAEKGTFYHTQHELNQITYMSAVSH